MTVAHTAGLHVIATLITCRYEEAEEACRNAVEIWEEKSGPATAVTCTSLELLAKIMRATGRTGETSSLHSSHPVVQAVALRRPLRPDGRL